MGDLGVFCMLDEIPRVAGNQRDQLQEFLRILFVVGEKGTEIVDAISGDEKSDMVWVKTRIFSVLVDE